LFILAGPTGLAESQRKKTIQQTQQTPFAWGSKLNKNQIKQSAKLHEQSMKRRNNISSFQLI
tara:strand:- start:573 stop:758 length:186 start_codon:yes stop_codon:yes gene_type:complete